MASIAATTSSTPVKTFITQVREVRDLQRQHYDTFDSAQKRIEEKKVEWQNKVNEIATASASNQEELNSFLEGELKAYLAFGTTASLAKDVLDQSTQVITACTRPPFAEKDLESLSGYGVNRNALNHNIKILKQELDTVTENQGKIQQIYNTIVARKPLAAQELDALSKIIKAGVAEWRITGHLKSRVGWTPYLTAALVALETKESRKVDLSAAQPIDPLASSVAAVSTSQ